MELRWLWKLSRWSGGIAVQVSSTNRFQKHVWVVVRASSNSSHSLTRHREEISSQKASLTQALRPPTSFPITRYKKHNFLPNTLHPIVGSSKAVIAAVLEKCPGHFKILFTNSAWNPSNFSIRLSVRIQFLLPYKRTGITQVSSTERHDRLVPIAHAQFTCNHINFYHFSVIMVAFEVLNESLSIQHLVLGGIPTNLYLSISTVTVPSWRRGFFSWRVEYVSSEVFCSGYMQIVEPFQSLQEQPTWLSWIPCPLLPRDDDHSHWSWHQHLYWMT